MKLSTFTKYLYFITVDVSSAQQAAKSQHVTRGFSSHTGIERKKRENKAAGRGFFFYEKKRDV